MAVHNESEMIFRRPGKSSVSGQVLMLLMCENWIKEILIISSRPEVEIRLRNVVAQDQFRRRRKGTFDNIYAIY